MADIPSYCNSFATASSHHENDTGEALESTEEVLYADNMIKIPVETPTATLRYALAPDEAGRREILRWLLFDNHKLTSYTATYRYLRVLAKNPDPAVMAEFRRRAESAWNILGAHLDGRRFVVGDEITIADISLCGYLFFDDEIGVDWDGYPSIRDWLARIRSEPGWKHPYELMPGHPLPASA